MTEKKFIEIMEQSYEFEWKGDNALKGLKIIEKYLPDTTIICGAGHDTIYSVNIEELILKDITEEDVRKIRDLNWTIDAGYLVCYV